MENLGKLGVVNTVEEVSFDAETQTAHFRLSLFLFSTYPSNLKIHTQNQETFNVSHFADNESILFGYSQKQKIKRKRG